MSETDNLFSMLGSTASGSGSLGSSVERSTTPTVSQTTARPDASPKPSNEATEETETNEVPKPDELTMLKQRAKLMGIQHSNNISLEALKTKISEKLNPEPETEEEEQRVEVSSPRKTLRQHLIDENLKLVRLRIQNLDPKKANLPGEILTVANEYIGTVRKFIPYGEVTDNGYHVPYCLYEMMRDRQFLNIKVTKRNGREHVESNYVKEFALEILPPLTREELKQLATAQIAAGSVE